MTGGDPAPFDVFVLPHTHWDREWYHTAGRFRQRLVELIDELLDEPDDGSSRFLLDGQAVVLDDYLAVRPERAGELSARLAAGSLEAGPWYVLADELIPGGESLVRNLLAGRRALRALRAEPPRVLYSPDAFGHPATLPVLARGFGCEVAIVWRGYGGRHWPAGDAARWTADDGSAVLLYHLPKSGYEPGANLPTEPAAAASRWARLQGELAPRARLGLLLVQNGADHHARQLRLREAVSALAAAAVPHRVRLASLGELGAELVHRAASAAPPLPEVRGELRDSYGYTWTLQGTLASRAWQKRRAARAERLLVRDTEPWAALAGRAGGKSRRAHLRAAWRTLLLCHPHDTLCGCSTDDVARAMTARLDDVRAQALGIRSDALRDLAGHDPVEARVQRDRWRPVVIVRNPAARARGGIAELEVVRIIADAPVGPGPAIDEDADSPRVKRGLRAPALAGGAVPVQEIERSQRYQRVESPRHYPANCVVDVRRAVAWVPPVAGYGITGLPVKGGGKGAKTPDVPNPVVAAANSLDNGRVRVAVDLRGEVRLSAPALGVEIPRLLGFDDTGEVGDLYTSSLVGAVEPAELLGAKVTHRGPLRGAIETRWRLTIPARTRTDRTRIGRGSRVGLGREVKLDITAVISLDADAPFVRIAISGENTAADHRLRAIIATGVPGGEVWADAAFGPVRRVPLAVHPDDAAMESPVPTAPLHRYVSLWGVRGGTTVYCDGLAEYEAMADGAVAVTLLRAVGELSRADLPERPGHAGWPVPTPMAQVPGPFGALLAVMPHGPRTPATVDAVERAADDVLCPLGGGTLLSATATPAPTAGAELSGTGLACSALTASESGDWMVARCVNLLAQPVEGVWRFGSPPPTEARLARLDETPLEPLDVRGGAVSFTAPPRGVVTILVR